MVTDLDRSPIGGEGPAILQLHKWGSSHPKLVLSEFREAFISPSRRLLLLLSREEEALLVPLITEDCGESGNLENCYGERVHRSDSALDEVPGSSGSASGFDCRNGFDRQYPFVGDVNSAAWGVCGDTYDQHKDSLFRELLFVSGNHGVTVHAFGEPDRECAIPRDVPEDDSEQGDWVEWGPSAIPIRNPWINTYRNGDDINTANGNGERLQSHEFSRDISSKTWLQSFITRTLDVESDGNRRTVLPPKSSFPSSANVISFHILNKNLPFPLLSMEYLKDKVDEMETDASFSVGNNSKYKCSKVFSNNSHDCVGFSLRMVDFVEKVDEKLRVYMNLVLIARLDGKGIHWVSFVKLDEKQTIGPLNEWVDFQFSGDLLVTLNSSGSVVWYSATSGEYVTHLDILQASGLKPQMKFHEQDGSTKDKNVLGTSNKQSNHTLGKSDFVKLIASPCSSLLAAMDEYGVVYVISPDDSASAEEGDDTNFHNLGFGMLAGYEVGGSDVSCQKKFHSGSNDGRNIIRSIEKLNLHGNKRKYTPCLSGFSCDLERNPQTFHEAETKCRPMRRIFLPSHIINQDDNICFSYFGITRLAREQKVNGQSGSRIVHFDLFSDSGIRNDDCLSDRESETLYSSGRKEVFVGDSVGCTFQGCFYLVSETGFSVVLPSVSVSSSLLPIESFAYRQWSMESSLECQVKDSLEMKESKYQIQPWTLEVLDRVLLYEGIEEAERFCFENGWDLKICRTRLLQLALDYLKFDDIEQCLAMLVSVNLAEEGILRVLFAAVYLMLSKFGGDNVSAASRLLALAARFATKMIRKYGLLLHDSYAYISQTPSSVACDESPNDSETSRRLREMAHLLEVIRNLQSRLSLRSKRPGQELAVGADDMQLVAAEFSQEDLRFSKFSADSTFRDTPYQNDVYAQNLDSTLKESNSQTNPDNFYVVSALVPREGSLENKFLSLENPKDMISRWKMGNLDLKTVVNDALLSGRLPLAVLQLHLHHSKGLMADEEPRDIFKEVQDIGRAIVYELFFKGETGLAVATLQRLGEDIESSLKQLLFGTVRRSLRAQIFDEMKRYGYLGPHEWKIMDRISLIERLYPSSSFWKTYIGRQKENQKVPENSRSQSILSLGLLNSDRLNTSVINCGEIDGVVLGSWPDLDENPKFTDLDNHDVVGGYCSAAAVWCNVWDQRTIDRIVLDQPFVTDVNVLWESQLDYHNAHGDWKAVSRLLDQIPRPILVNGSLQISVDNIQNSGTGLELSKHGYLCSLEDLEDLLFEVPNIKILKLPCSIMGSSWLKMNIEEKLAKKLIFMRESWSGTEAIVNLLARSGFISSKHMDLVNDDDFECSSDGKSLDDDDTLQALHRLVVYHSVKNNLPYVLDLYLDQKAVALDNVSLSSVQDAAGDCEWAKWLLLSRVKGCEFEASFSNARSISSQNIVPDYLSSIGTNEIIHTVDDIAEGGGELAALATLMYAPIPIQKCLNSGGVKRNGNSSAQCTLENLKPTFQCFPTLCRTFMSVCFGEDKNSSFLGSQQDNALTDYLNWRDNIFFSSGTDTSLLQMLPCWFPKAVRRLVQLYVQGPLGWQSISGMPIGETLRNREIDFFVNIDEHAEINAISWEATIQKHIEEELYDPTLEETSLGLEQHLHRGRALSAFNRLLDARVHQLKSEGQSSESANIQSDMQRLFAPLTESEEPLLLSVTPLAIMHFEDLVMVASCAFILELCGLSANMLRVDIASLRRISSHYKSIENGNNLTQTSPKHPAFHAGSREGDIVQSLARALADDYLLQNNSSNIAKKKKTPVMSGSKPSRALVLVLHHLEKASLPLMIDGNTCGSWLLSGEGNGIELRNQQKASGQQWNLVRVFCQIHQLPLSKKYLAVLARDNDWVGFLSEAQTGGYPFDAVLQVASKEFSDPRLRTHILTVLKSMQSRKKAGQPHADTSAKGTETFFPDEQLCYPVELFKILAECEKQKNPGNALLTKAKDLSWSILAMIASCFPDVSPLSCLTVWLEITAARETSSIKVNDIATQISEHVQAAVEATNSLPPGSRNIAFHFNRRNPKRRRIAESVQDNHSAPANSVSNIACSSGEKVYLAQNFAVDDERKVKLVDSDDGPVSLSKMVAVLCEQNLFLPLLRAFEMFLPSCSFLPFIRALQAFSQMRISEASAHLGSFSARIKDEASQLHPNVSKDGQVRVSWISSMAVEAADATLLSCPSPYEKRCLLQLLQATEFGDGGSIATHYRRLYWKINLAEPSLRKDDLLQLGDDTLDDASLLSELEKNGHWDQARNWAKQLEASGEQWKSAVHHVTETQAESMVAEWKEFLWDVPEERFALWGHCQTLFIRYSFPALQAGLFFLKHAEAVEKDLPARELHELLLLSLQWLSGMITLSNPVYPLNLLREIETKVWLLAVESEAQMKSEGEFNPNNSIRDPINKNTSNIIDRTASIITKMDNHVNSIRNRAIEKQDARENNPTHYKNQYDATKTKRRAKGYIALRRAENEEKNTVASQDDSVKTGMPFSRWEERVEPEELERAVLSLLEFGQISAAKQLQNKLSPSQVPSEFILVDVALRLAALSTPSELTPLYLLDEEIQSIMKWHNLMTDENQIDPLQVLEILVTVFTERRGKGLCKRIIAIVKSANVLGLPFQEAFCKQPIELLQLLSLKAQESFEEAKLLVETHSMPAASIAQILAESFLKGLLAAHRGGYMDSQKEEGPAPLLWRFSDFLKWAELCPTEPEVGHALMRMVITGQEIPHACEVELLILSHHFYKSSACLDGVDVLVALAATRVDEYVSEGDFPCLARLITGVGNFHTLNFILGILIENGQLDLLLQKLSAAADASRDTADAVRGFRMAVLTSLKHFNSNDLDAFAMVYNHFDMKHETAALLESRADQSSEQWFRRKDRDHNEDLLNAMRYSIEAAEVHSSIDAGNKTRRACAHASLLSLQIRMPDIHWLRLSETNARRAVCDQSRFQEALIVAEAYKLNQPSEWALVLWNQMLKPELLEEFIAEFVAVLPLQPSMLIDLARFYRAEVAARGDQSQFSVWLTGGGLPAEWAKYLGRSFRCLLRRTRDLRLRLQLSVLATGFNDVIDVCSKVLDKVPENTGPLVLRKGHGGAYLPLM